MRTRSCTPSAYCVSALGPERGLVTSENRRGDGHRIGRPGSRLQGYLLPPPGTTDAASVDHGSGKDAGREIKEWQAIMDHLRNLPVTGKGELPVIPVDAGAAEVRAVKQS